VGSTRPVDDYLGHVELRGKRILEIGPASGFLTVEMEKRGALLAASTSP
jgi:16S rRNA A1518/A1519 N6-dimethyltransferase RsmA/KsgA/DIM1 with predicted DNA glycosylase/AP lyase activity